jgi:hypothetical protein
VPLSLLGRGAGLGARFPSSACDKDGKRGEGRLSALRQSALIVIAAIAVGRKLPRYNGRRFGWFHRGEADGGRVPGRNRNHSKAFIPKIACAKWEYLMSIGTLLLIVLILLLLGAVPAWPYSRGWGYYPSGFVGVLLIVVIVLLLTGAFSTA